MQITREQCGVHARKTLNTTRAHCDTIRVRVLHSEDVSTCAAAGTERHTRLLARWKTITPVRMLIAATCDTSRQHSYVGYLYTMRHIVHQLYRTSTSSSTTIATHFIANQLAPLWHAPILDCNRWRNCHIGTRSYMDRH